MMNTINLSIKQFCSSICVLLIMVLLCPKFSFAQQASATFKSIHEQSVQYPLARATDTLACLEPTEQLARQLITREFWPVYDLYSMDCILTKISKTQNTRLEAVFYFIAAGAYNDFDQEVSDSLLKDAYLLFRELDDIEGQLFTSVELLDNSISTLETTRDSSIASFFTDIKNLASKTTYTPAVLAALDAELLYKHKKNQVLPEAELDSLLNHADQFLEEDSIRIRNIYTRLFSLYQIGGFNVKANQAARKALALANAKRADYPSFFYNIGFNKYMLGEIDSALFYFSNAYQQSVVPKTLYQYNLKYISAQGMAVSYKKIGQVDSAYKYLGKALYAAVDFANYEANDKRLYAEKKFDLQKRRLDVLERDLALAVQEKKNDRLLFMALSVAVLFLGAMFLGVKNARLLKQSKALEYQRERLIHILSHDLRSPLHAFLQSADTIGQLVALQRFDDVAKVGKSLEYTGNTLQETIANLEDWSDYLKSSNATMGKQMNPTCNPFEIAAKAKELYNLQAEKAGVHVEIKNTKEFTVPCRAFELSLITRNLIANSIKHAVSGSTVIIEIKKSDRQNFRMAISNTADQEKALLAEKSINQATSLGTFHPNTSTRFGLFLVFGTVNKLGGSIHAYYKEGILTIEVVLPLSKQAKDR